MPRPKGSKNKPKTSPTATETLSTSTVETSPTDNPPEKKKRHRRTKAEMEAYRASLAQNQSSEPGPDSAPDSETGLEKIPETIIEEVVSENSEVSTAEVDTSVGVESEPEKIPENNISNNSTPESTQKAKKIKQSKSSYPLCDCCQREIYCQPHRIDTNSITAQIADYHRESPRWVNLCYDCAKKLSDTVDNWLQSNGCLTRMEQRMRNKENEQ